MNVKKTLIALATSLLLSQSRYLASQGGVGAYCDEWNKCDADNQCVQKKCVPLVCSQSSPCSQGFQCMNGKCVSQTPIGDNGRYCDQWTPCQSDNRCVSKKCVPLKCQWITDCASGFSCFAGQCISGSWSGIQGTYCDAWTRCGAKDQCVNKKCVPLACTRTPDCAFNYSCYQGYCIQISQSHTRGRYCDEQNECDVLHKCVDSQCVWK